MNESQKGACKLGAAIGAVLVHPMLGLAAFVWGAVFGSKPFMPDGARPIYGLDGGLNAAFNVWFAYLFTFGIAPLVVTAVGAVVGTVVSFVRYNRKHNR